MAKTPAPPTVEFSGQETIPGTPLPPVSVTGAKPPAGPAATAPKRRPDMPAADSDLAPHGWRWSGKEWVAKRPPGRPKSAAPRVQTTAQARRGGAPVKPPDKTDPVIKPAEYQKVLHEAGQAVWLLGAIAPLPDRAFGRDLVVTRTRLRVQADLLGENLGPLSAGLAKVAEHVPWMARQVQAMGKGRGGLWVLPVMMVLTPFAVQSMALWRGELDPHAVAERARHAEEQAAEFLKLALAQVAEEAAQMAEGAPVVVDGSTVEGY